MLASCWVYRAQALDTEQGDAASRSLVGTDMCPASREHRSNRNEVWAISPWVFDGGEALPMD